MDHVDTIVIGAGVIGLAVGRAMALRGDSVLVIERETSFGTGTSSRNSEVIHAGIYYPEESLKRQTCVEGKAMLYAYLAERQVPYQKCGKFIVATSESQVANLEQIQRRAETNGVFDLNWLSPSEVKQHEPAVSCVAALHSPSTGIIDSHSYMQSLLADIEQNGGQLVTNAIFAGVRQDGGMVVSVLDAGSPYAEPFEIRCSRLINSAGLHAQDIARKIEGLDASFVPELHLAKGSYFNLPGKAPFSRLIYPVPESGGLGVHVTIDIGGQVRFGPDVEWVETIDYNPDPSRSVRFYDAIRQYYPDLADGSLVPAYCGIRPKLRGEGAGDSDFVISGPGQHGVEGLVNLFGIESPGLTGSLAIAERVAYAAFAVD